MYWWQLRYPYAAHGLGLNLFAAIPFLGLAAMVIGGMGRVATGLGWLILAALTGIAYVAAATSASSTAALVFIAPFFYGAVAVSILFAIDQVIRRRNTLRRRPGLR
jgi:hypothetical protein